MAEKQNGPPPRRPPASTPWSQAGMALMIPSLMAAGPLAGFLVGWGIRAMTGWGEWVMAVCVLLGLAAGMRETIHVIRRLK